jgi:hypothetical protein
VVPIGFSGLARLVGLTTLDNLFSVLQVPRRVWINLMWIQGLVGLACLGGFRSLSYPHFFVEIAWF